MPAASWAFDQESLQGFATCELLKIPGGQVGVIGAVRAATSERTIKHPGEPPQRPPGPVPAKADSTKSEERSERVQHRGIDGVDDSIAARGCNGGDGGQNCEAEADDAAAEVESECRGQISVQSRG